MLAQVKIFSYPVYRSLNWHCPFWRTIWQTIKCKIHIPFNPAFLFLGIYLRETDAQRDMTKDVHCCGAYAVKYCKPHKCPPIRGWLNKIMVIHTVEENSNYVA